ncbi:MAG TPA: dihydroxy-acid dehydratase, partial [Actinomycetaceae bacterium]|nr:dihydroxy-acid dehydratase [Actinomycetaceae bacterium]
VEEVFLRAAQQGIHGKTDESLAEFADMAIRSPGVCSGLATANSMHIAAEALGMTVSGAAPVRALSESMWDAARRAARAMAHAIEHDIRPRDILTAGSVTNAARAMLAIGGSINTIKHLQAIAIEAGVEVDMWDVYRTLGRETPILCSIRPNGDHLVEDLEDAGGAATILRELLPLLDGEQLTITGKTVAENAAAARPGDGDVIRDLDNPFSTDPSIVVLRGSLATEGAVVKRPVPDPGPYTFRGPARIFHSREEGVEAVVNDEIKPGDVAIIRGIGLTGSPAMGMISAFIFALDGRGLLGDVAVVTDGQMSGLVNHGIGVGEVSPEAAEGGALGLVQDGDIIEIDLKTGSIDLLVDPAELEARPPYTPPTAAEISGYLAQYRDAVQPLACGAVLRGLASSSSVGGTK